MSAEEFLRLAKRAVWAVPGHNLRRVFADKAWGLLRSETDTSNPLFAEGARLLVRSKLGEGA